MSDLDKDVADIIGLNPGEEIDADELGGDYGPLPEGEYHVEIVECKLKENNQGTGDLLKYQFKVLMPSKYENSRVFYQMNINHSNKDTQEIARKDYKRLVLAVGGKTIPDSFADLIGCECFVIVRHRTYIYDGEERIDTDVKKVSPVDGNPQGVFETEDSDTSTDTSDGSDSFDDDDISDIPF